MTVFPSLTPSARTFTPGQHGHTPLRTMGGQQTQVRHSNVITGTRLSLGFTALSPEQLLALRSHFISRRGSFFTFALPSTLWHGTTDPTPAGYSWRYVEKPRSRDRACPWRDVTVELEMVADFAPDQPTGATVVRIPARAIAVATLAPVVNIANMPTATIAVAALVPGVQGDPP